MFTVPTARVLLGLVCSPLTVVLVLLALVVAGLAVWLPEALVVVLPSAIAPVLGLVSGLYSRLERSWGFTLSEVPSGVRTRAGLFNERSSTIPTGRVQALEVTAPLLWRGFGGHRVTVTTAGKGGAAELEERLHRAHEESSFSWSWGVVAVQTGEELDDAIARADGELYRGRGAGLSR